MIKFRYLFMGSHGCGKTSIINRYIYNDTNNLNVTVGADFYLKELNYNNNIIKLQLWDLADSPTFRAIAVQFYKNIDYVILVYDITDIGSFDRLKFWYNNFLENYRTSNKLNVSPEIILVGNKIDLLDDKFYSHNYFNDPSLFNARIKSFIDIYDIKLHFKVSATKGININKLFNIMNNNLFNKYNIDISNNIDIPNNNNLLNNNPHSINNNISNNLPDNTNNNINICSCCNIL